MRGFLKLPIAFLFIFLFVWIASPVSAAGEFWSTPVKISQSTNNALMPVEVTDSKGYVHSVWMEVGSSWESLPSPGLFYSFWNGDVWSTPQLVNVFSTDEEGNKYALGRAEAPSLAITSNDNLHLVWNENSPSEPYGSQVYYSVYSGGSWSTPVSLSSSIHQVGYSWEWAARIASDSSDNLHVLFSYSDEVTNEAKVYYTKYSGGSWSTPVNISQGLDVQFPALVVDSSGNVHVLLWDTKNGTLNRGGIFYTYYNGSVWSTIQKISTSEATGYDFNRFPSLVIDGSNNLNAAWYYRFGDVMRAYYARKPSAGNWSTPFIVSTTLAESAWSVPLIGLTVDSSGNAYVGWGQFNSTFYPDTGLYGVDAMYRKYDVSLGTWSNPSLIRSTKYFDSPTIWRDKWWNQHFVWSEMNTSTNQWEYWYSEVPANSSSYNPASQMTITMVVTNDTLKIPNNALATTATISAQVGPVPASASPSITTIPRSYTFRPNGTTFINNKKATATINYIDAEVIGTDERNLKVYIWDSALNNWSTTYNTSVNVNTNKISVDLDHFSLYGIMGPKVRIGWQPPLSESQTYDLVHGGTLPIKFRLAYYDGTNITPLRHARDLAVVIREKTTNRIRARYYFGSGPTYVQYDPATQQYWVDINAQTLYLGPGEYLVQTYLFGQTQPTGVATFRVLPLAITPTSSTSLHSSTSKTHSMPIPSITLSPEEEFLRLQQETNTNNANSGSVEDIWSNASE